MFYVKEINADIAKSAWHKAVNVSLFCYPTLLDKLDSNISDAIYKFENPTTLKHHLSAVVHDRLKKSIFDHSIKNSIEINPLIMAYYSSDDEALKMSLGLN